MSAEDSLESLMKRYIDGDLRAFDELYARVAPRVARFLQSMVRGGMGVEDLCQTTFLKLHRGRSGWIPGSPVLPWVMAIARNAFYDDVVRAKRSRTDLTETGAVPDIADPRDLEAALTREHAPASAELAEALATAMASLPPRQREAFAMTKLGGLTHRDAALALGTTELAVRLRVHRAYQALRVLLREHEERDP